MTPATVDLRVGGLGGLVAHIHCFLVCSMLISLSTIVLKKLSLGNFVCAKSLHDGINMSNVAE